MGNKSDYNKAKSHLKTSPESMFHSFATVMEREAPISEDHLSKDILRSLNSAKTGIDHMDIVPTVRDPIDTDDEEEPNTSRNATGGNATGGNATGGSLQIFTWNIAHDQQSVDQQKKTIQKYLDKVDIMAFQELFRARLDGYGLDFSNYEEYHQRGSTGNNVFTFIKKSLSQQLVKGDEFKPGRPFIVNSLIVDGEKTFFINVHVGHEQSGITTTLDASNLNKLQTAVAGQTFKRLILAGDFNSSPTYVTLNGIIANNIVPESKRRTINTCCNDFRSSCGPNPSGYIDNILDSYYKPSLQNKYKIYLLWATEVNRTTAAKDLGSDHTPVVASLPFRYSMTGGNTTNSVDQYNRKEWAKIGKQFLSLL